MVYISRGTMIETCNDLQNLYKFFQDAGFRAMPPPSVKRRFENFMVSGYPTPFARTRTVGGGGRTRGFRMLRSGAILLHRISTSARGRLPDVASPATQRSYTVPASPASRASHEPATKQTSARPAAPRAIYSQIAPMRYSLSGSHRPGRSCMCSSAFHAV